MVFQTQARGEDTPRMKVLLIDDESLVRKIVARIFRRRGYEVIAASDGLEGLQLYALHQHEIGVVILDQHMPYLDGTKVLRFLRAEDRHLPVVLSSGDEYIDGFVRDAHTDMISKPYAPADLLALTEHHLKTVA